MPAAKKKPARDDAQLRRAQVLDETIRIIGQRGYHGFTVQELAKRCGLSNAGLLYYFPSKDELLVAALQELERRETEAIQPISEHALRNGATDPEAVLALFKAMVGLGVSDPEGVRLDIILRSEALDASHPAYNTFRTRDRDVLNLFAKVLAPYSQEPRATARRIYAVMDGLGEQWMRSNKAFDLLEEIVSAIVVFVPALAPKPRRATSKRTRK